MLMMLTSALFPGCGPSTPERTSKDASSIDQSRDAIGEGHTFVYEGPLPQTFQEAPSLAERFAKGELPLVSERLPEEPPGDPRR